MVNENDKYKFWNFCMPFWIYQPLNAYHAMIYFHQEHNFTLKKVHTNMLYVDMEWLIFHLHIHLKVYYRNYTSNTL